MLLCDGALQFTWVTEALALCWVHEGRHDKKLIPVVGAHRALLATFLTDFWDDYDQLLASRAQPTADERQRLDAAFDALFSRKTGYWDLESGSR